VVTLGAAPLGRLRRHTPDAGHDARRRGDEEQAQDQSEAPSSGHRESSIRPGRFDVNVLARAPKTTPSVRTPWPRADLPLESVPGMGHLMVRCL